MKENKGKMVEGMPMNVPVNILHLDYLKYLEKRGNLVLMFFLFGLYFKVILQEILAEYGK